MNTRDCREALTRLLQDHIERIATATACLDELKNAIAENSVEGLQTVLSGSDTRLSSLDNIEAERHELLQRFGYSADRAGFEQCIAACDDSGELGRLHESLSAGLDALQRAIQLNHLLVAKGQDRIRRSLGILTGIGSGGQDNTYSRSGKADHSDGRRDIAVA